MRFETKKKEEKQVFNKGVKRLEKSTYFLPGT